VGIVGQGAQVLALVLALPLLIRTLGVETYGVFNVVLVVVSYLTLLNCGLAQGLTKLAAEALGRDGAHEVPVLFWISIAAVTVIGVGGAVLLASAAPLLVDHVFAIPAALKAEATRAIRVGALAVPSAIVVLNLSGLLDAYQRFSLTSVLRASANALNILLPLAAALAGAGLATMLGLIVIKNLLFVLILFTLCWKLVPAIRGGFAWDAAQARALFVFAGWTALLSPSLLVQGTLDRLVIGMVLGMRALTYYAVPQQITNTLGGLAVAVMPVLYPTFSRLFVSDQRRMESLHREAAGCIALGMGLACFAIAVCGREILRLWVGRDFGASAAVLEILCLSAFLGSLYQVTGTLLQGTRHVRLVVVVTYLSFATQAVLVWSFLARAGVVGAAWASALTQALALVLIMAAAVKAELVAWRRLMPLRVALACGGLVGLATCLLYLKSALRPPDWVVLGATPLLTATLAWLAWRYAILEAPTKAALTSAVGRLRLSFASGRSNSGS
jgi:O-antigen/teichoic acid export membrane protein